MQHDMIAQSWYARFRDGNHPIAWSLQGSKQRPETKSVVAGDGANVDFSLDRLRKGRKPQITTAAQQSTPRLPVKLPRRLATQRGRTQEQCAAESLVDCIVEVAKGDHASQTVSHQVNPVRVRFGHSLRKTRDMRLG